MHERETEIWSDWPPGNSGFFWIVWKGIEIVAFRDSGPAGLAWEIGDERFAEIDLIGDVKFGPPCTPPDVSQRVAAVLEAAKGLVELEDFGEKTSEDVSVEANRLRGLIKPELSAVLSLLRPEKEGG